MIAQPKSIVLRLFVVRWSGNTGDQNMTSVTFSCVLWFLMLVGTPALAIDGVHLDRCQQQLTGCYEACKANGKAAKACSDSCTTERCGLPWREGFAAFIDRRIEESAVRPTGFVGLSRMKGTKQR
jgi:hypothetical protein